jgi:membrane complex biogenesis BtpA family protein
VAGVTAAAMLVRNEFPDLHLGINVLRNDVVSALGVAAAVGARFVRVNVHTGAAVTDQGTIQGQAWRTLRRRRELGADRVAILADVRVKHARPLVDRPLAEEVSDLRSRGLADGIIVSGVATGAGADPAEAAEVREAMPEGPILVGSGTTAENVGAFLPAADGFIIGSSLQEPDPATGRRRVSAARTAAFVAALKTATAKDTWQ